MNIILFGAPGAGKGTQAEKLVNKYHLTHISTGEMFREAIANNTEMGKKANTYIAKGMLVPDEVTVGIVKDRLALEDCKNGFILDGFPRTLHQAECLDTIMKELNMKIDYVIDIESDFDELLKRLSGRRVCKNCGNSYHVVFKKPQVEGVCDACGGTLYIRKDDNVDSVKVRLETYKSQTEPLIDFYTKKDVLVRINGQQGIEEVFNEIVVKLGDNK